LIILTKYLNFRGFYNVIRSTMSCSGAQHTKLISFQSNYSITHIPTAAGLTYVNLPESLDFSIIPLPLALWAPFVAYIFK